MAGKALGFCLAFLLLSFASVRAQTDNGAWESLLEQLYTIDDVEGDTWEQTFDGLAELAQCHFGDFGQVARLAEDALDGELSGVHAFCDSDIFAAVYSSNLLMRCSDVLITKPSEFSFYPVPKLMIHRVGGHEAWGAIRAAEVGDGTYEIDDTAEVLAMIDSFQREPQLVSFMCDRIEDAKRLGMYDGAYKVIDLAVNGVR
jgi:hypothetical protein